jgi:transposase InsO family protein
MPGHQGGAPDQQPRCTGEHGRRHADAGRAQAHSIRQRRRDDGKDRAQLVEPGRSQNPVHRTGSPRENGYCESFNGKLRDELLNGEIFYSLKEAQIVIEQWRRHYNTIRPHSALNYRPPAPQTFAPSAHHLDEILPMQ